MYCVQGPRQLGRNNFHDLWARFADTVWRPVNGYSLEWRIKFYQSLLSSEHAKDAFRLIEYHDERENTEQEVGMVAILPLRATVAADHLKGAVSQYDFQGKHLSISHSVRAQSFHYVQSVYLHPDHLRSITALEKMREAIRDLLKHQFCGYRQRPFFIYSEPILPPGRRLAIGQGLQDLSSKSKEEVEIFGFDSTVHNNPALLKKIRNLWCRDSPRAA